MELMVELLFLWFGMILYWFKGACRAGMSLSNSPDTECDSTWNVYSSSVGVRILKCYFYTLVCFSLTSYSWYSFIDDFYDYKVFTALLCSSLLIKLIDLLFSFFPFLSL